MREPAKAEPETVQARYLTRPRAGSACGHPLHLGVHKTEREGSRQGALRDALPTATGTLIGIFDADSVPPPDWLRRTVPRFREARPGYLQTRWGHTNRGYNSLTRAEALAVDAHFLIEQLARAGSLGRDVPRRRARRDR